MTEKETMHSPACETCGKTTRLVGLERHADDPAIEVLTFYCDKGRHYTAVEAKTGVYRGPVVSK